MTSAHAIHTTFTIERTYPVAAAKVFAAWSTPQAKAQWFSGPAPWKEIQRTFDFRVGGRDELHGRFHDGPITIFKSHYYDIVSNERIVYAYEMLVGGERISVSLTSILLTACENGTRMAVTEQGIFFDGATGAAAREQGTIVLIDRLGESLKALL